MSDVTDPYAPPEADLINNDNEQARAENIREDHLKHEASVRSVGLLYYLNSFGALAGVVLLGSVLASEGATASTLGLIFLLAV